MPIKEDHSSYSGAGAGAGSHVSTSKASFFAHKTTLNVKTFNGKNMAIECKSNATLQEVAETLIKNWRKQLRINSDESSRLTFIIDNRKYRLNSSDTATTVLNTLHSGELTHLFVKVEPAKSKPLIRNSL
jgi:hypothetical protein